MNTLPASDKLIELAQLMRLRTIKTKRAYEQKLAEWKAFKNIVDETQSRIDNLQNGLNVVALYKENNKHVTSPLSLQDASDRRQWLIYDQDLEIYNIDIARGDLDEATTELNALKASWLKAQQRELNIDEQSEDALQAESLHDELLEEAEIEDLQLSGCGLDG